MAGEMDLRKLIQGMKPKLNPGSFVFCTLPEKQLPLDVAFIASFREEEGVTVVLEQVLADQKGWSYESGMAWITLTVHSALEAVGLTAAFSSALAQEGISCNVIAGYYHDHLFVPLERAKDAMNALQRLSSE
ncbi:MAG: ACT domain-containing protein [Saprospiraceae bacterium]|nr:ACT domain-containing protein [Saprospiraceae bacterium]